MASNLETLIFEIIAKDKNASAAFDSLRRSVDGSTTSVDKNSQALQKNQKAQTSAIGAAVGTGVAFSAMLSPLAAAGSGVVAYAAMAAPSILKVKTALSGPGGLSAAWGTLDNRQRNMALGVQALSARYHGLSLAMEPRVAQTFGTALGIVNGALGPFGLLAKNAGTALEGFLVQFSADAGLNQFITFMAREAGPAIRLLGTDIINISHAVFALLQSWGGLGLAELKLVTTVITGITASISWLAEHVPAITGIGVAIGGIALALSKMGLLSSVLRLTGLSAAFSEIMTVTTGIKELSVAERGLAASEALMNSISPFGWIALGVTALAGLAFLMTKADKAEQDLIATTLKANQAQGFNTQGFRDAAAAIGTFRDNLSASQRVTGGARTGMAQLSQAARTYTDAQQAVNDGVAQQNRFLARLQSQYGLTRAQAVQLANASGVQVDKNGQLVDGFKKSVTQADAFANANRNAKQPVMGLAAAVTSLTTDLDKQVTAVLTLQGDQLAWRSAMQQANTQLASNSAGLKGNSANAIANKQAVLATTTAAIAFAKEQLTSKGNLAGASREIQGQIRWLQGLHDKSGFAKDEIKVLVGWLRQIKSEQATIKVSGTGSWSVSGAPGHLLPHHRPSMGAAGMLVSGGIPGRDSVPILAMPGEAVVPRHLVPPIAPFLRAHGVPGFADGGVVGSYSDGVRGLSTWLARENTATLTAMENSVAMAVLAAIRQGPSGGPGGLGSGPGGPVEAVARALFPWAASQWPSFNYVEMREAGYSLTARNPTSGAYGVAQFINGPPEYFQWGGNPFTAAGQFTAMFNYIRSRYGTPFVAAEHEAAFNWYDQGGWLPPGISIAANGTGRPERVGGGDTYNITVNMPPGSDGADVVRALQAYAKRNGPIRLRVRS